MEVIENIDQLQKTKKWAQKYQVILNRNGNVVYETKDSDLVIQYLYKDDYIVRAM